MLHSARHFTWWTLRWQYTALRYSFPNLEPVFCSMSGSNCCFLTCIQISQEAGKVVCYSHLFMNFPVCCDPHSQRLSVVNEAVDVFVKFSCFFYESIDVGNLISGSSAFSKSSLNIWKLSVMYYWSLAWRILSITLLVCEMSAIVWYFEHCLTLPFFGIGVKTDLFQSYGLC